MNYQTILLKLQAYTSKLIIMETIFTHRSIRKYKNTQIPPDILNRILEAGTRASNTGNMQVYSIIVTKDEDLRKRLWETHFKQNMVLQAPVILTFCADVNRFSKWCWQSDAEPGYQNFLWFMNGAIDAVLASQNCCLEAEKNKLGICYLGTTTYMAEKIIEILQIPKGVVPITTIALGYPDENPGLTDRLPLKAIIHDEVYHDYSTSFINELYQEKESLKESLELVSINETKNLAQIFTQKRYKKTDNETFSKLFLKVLQNQGFMNPDE